MYFWFKYNGEITEKQIGIFVEIYRKCAWVLV